MTITLRIVSAVLLLCLAFAPFSFARVPPKKAIVAYVFVKDAVLGPNDVAAGSLTRVNYAFANIEMGKSWKASPTTARIFRSCTI